MTGFSSLPAVGGRLLIRRGLLIGKPDRNLVHPSENPAHPQTRVELGALIPFQMLGANSDLVVARSASGLPAHVLLAPDTDLSPRSSKSQIYQIDPRFGP